MRSPVSVQIFATDINEAAIEKARRGTYIENIAADVSAERLARFFTRAGGIPGRQKGPRTVRLLPARPVTDPTFSRMDLVSCRNVLIYLDSVQESVFSRGSISPSIPEASCYWENRKRHVSSPGLFAPWTGRRACT